MGVLIGVGLLAVIATAVYFAVMTQFTDGSQ
jgi:hypothetical protein